MSIQLYYIEDSPNVDWKGDCDKAWNAIKEYVKKFSDDNYSAILINID